jgi:hypothetical protein
MNPDSDLQFDNGNNEAYVPVGTTWSVEIDKYGKLPDEQGFGQTFFIILI